MDGKNPRTVRMMWLGHMTPSRLNTPFIAWSNKATFDQDSYGAHRLSSFEFFSLVISFLTTNFNHAFFRCLFYPLSYGGERYEKRELQIRVRHRFAELQSIDEKHGRVPWYVVDASKSVDEVKEMVSGIVSSTIERVESGTAPLRRMWREGEYELPTTTLDRETSDKDNMES
jgi:hypothetical protein